MSVKEAEKTIDILSETRKTQTETPQSEKQKINSDIRKQMLGFSQAYFNAQSTTAEDLWSYFSLENHLHPTTASYEEDRTYVMDFFTRMITYQKEQQKKCRGRFFGIFKYGVFIWNEYFEKRGGYVLNKLDRRMTGTHYSEALNYAIKLPDGTNLFPGSTTEKQEHWNWRWSKSKLNGA